MDYDIVKAAKDEAWEAVQMAQAEADLVATLASRSNARLRKAKEALQDAEHEFQVVLKAMRADSEVVS